MWKRSETACTLVHEIEMNAAYTRRYRVLCNRHCSACGFAVNSQKKICPECMAVMDEPSEAAS